MSKKGEVDDEINDEPIQPKLTKKGQKPRTLTPEHLEKLKIAREKARITQKKNAELRKLERENKLHDDAKEKAKREKAIKEKNKEIKNAVNHKEPILKENVEEVEDEDEYEVKSQVKEKKKPKKKPVIIVEASSDSDSDDQQVIYIKNKSKQKERQTAPHQPPEYTQPPHTSQVATLSSQSATLGSQSATLPIPVPMQSRQYPINPFFNTHYKRY